MSSTDQTGRSKGRRLDSWKAIAQFLDRDVRSVQRWEHERGLPVHRLPGQRGGAVFAYESELEDWMLSRGSDATVSSDVAPEAEALPSATPSLMRWGIGLAAAAAAIVVGSVFILYSGHKPVPVHAPLPPPSIAVLPMQNFSGDAAQDYFADGFTEELTTELAEVHSLRVISRTSAMLYRGSRKPLPQIARELQARYILEGSVAREGQRVRVIAQLIDARSDTHVSARRYDSDLKDVLDIQSRISRAIADDVRLDLSPVEKSRLASAREVDPEAYDLYLKASYQFAQQTQASIKQSLVLYTAAAAKDPTFARAYVGIAQAHTALLQITAESPDESTTSERDALSKALAIDPHQGDAHGLLASLVYYHDWDWPRAEHEFRLALAEGAQAPTEQRFGFALLTRGRFAEGNAHLQAALELDPLGKSPRITLVIALIVERRLSDARRELNELLASNPDFLAGHVLLGSLADSEHDCAQADIQAQWVVAHFPSPMADVDSSFANACRGDVAAARKNLEHAAASKASAFASPYQIALGYASIRDRDAAIAYLRESADLREPQILHIKVDPVLDPIRTDPRFVALEKRLGLLQ
jgi:TolB-like protein/Tfp pilus assembly protein PilF